MLSRRLGCALLVGFTMLGCDPPAQAPAGPASTSATATAGATATASAPAKPANTLTGVLSEADFKKLHELKAQDAPPLGGEMIKLSQSDAYLSLPKGKQPPLAAVIVVHEWWGLNQHIKHWADRLAEDGYAALAVDLYGGKSADTPDAAMELMKAVQPDSAKAVLQDAAAFVQKDPRIVAKKRASIGWCFGGKWSLETALVVPDMTAAVVYYGHVSTDPAELSALTAPLLGIFANQDQGIPPATVNAFEEALKKDGKQYKILRYDAQHAFANPSSARYDQPSAEKAWIEVRAFLKQHLKGE